MNNFYNDNILKNINNPDDLQSLNLAELQRLAFELREYIIDTVSKTGGHLAPSLGAVDLTLALYSVFSLPRDKVIWDVGHQAYAHKILTGRREGFLRLRQKNGITGFPSRAESPYDAFGVGHASTSISAALGMAIARDLKGTGEHIIAVIGDGAMTGGEAFEALNHAGDLAKNLIVVLNDNGRSIDYNVGAMSEYLSRLRVRPEYSKTKKDIKEILSGIPHIGDKVFKTAEFIKEGVKSVLVPGIIFEEMGFKYVGPIDGHNIGLMREVFEEVRLMDSPVLVHVRTKKGCGYIPAENAPDKFHGVGKFDISTGNIIKDKAAPPSYTSVFSKALVELGNKNKKIVAVTAAMPEGTGLKQFAEHYPDRFFDVGIAEEHAVTLAAGMAANGMRPVVAIYSTFAQRAYDQLLHDVCLQNLPVVMCLDRAGLVGADGSTHHGAFDLSYLRSMPNMTIMAPKDENELRHMLYTALEFDGPTAIRYPRGSGTGAECDEPMHLLQKGKGEVICEGDSGVALIAAGNMVNNAVKAAKILANDDINVTVVNARFIKPLDNDLICQIAGTHKILVTIEENVLMGGFGAAVLEFISDEGIDIKVKRLGIPDRFIGQGTQAELREECGLMPEQIASTVNEMRAR
ncbi:MAG: 1-deoxy-D-xylulose-5-phosphate synthase [Schwartzia sp.]|nr:1-deoxy-D-xylulose-5-phosphate synthase [Schwartzia sp. (in: firmicutes)]